MIARKGLQEFERKAESINQAVLEAKEKNKSLKQEAKSPKKPSKNEKVNF